MKINKSYVNQIGFTFKFVWLFILIYVPPLIAEIKNSKPLDSTSRYLQLTQPNMDGIGKFYFGREISHVMGHQGANWLERPERELEERPDMLIQSLNIKPQDVVADIGVGTGYIAWRMARKLSSEGLVYGVDIQQEMLDLFVKNMADRGFTNVKAVLGTITNPKLPPNSIDLVVMVDVYHELSYPYEMMRGICRALKVGGRVAFVEYRAEDPSVPIKRLHKMTELQVLKEATPHPLEWVGTIDALPRQHLIIFKKTPYLGDS